MKQPWLDGAPVVVTGGAGFVGANLLRRLIALDADVHALVRPTSDPWRIAALGDRLTVHEVDLLSPSSVRAIMDGIGPQVVFHVAKHRGNPAHLDYGAAFDANVRAALTLLEASSARPLIRFVHVGSSLEYGTSDVALREDMALQPTTVHGVTKAAATLLCQQYARSVALPLVILRLFTVYGPWEGPERFVPRVVMGAIEGRQVPVTGPGLGHDWIHVDDVVDAMVRAVERDLPPGEIVNIGTGRQSSNEDVVHIVERVCGCRIRVLDGKFEARPWDSTTWVADVTKARQLLGWSAGDSLETGIEKTVAWFREHRGLYRS